MTKHLFILGRNPKLSFAEIVSYFQARKMNFEIVSGKDNALLIEADLNEKKMVKHSEEQLQSARFLFNESIKKF
jgi:tRNA G10  N-methylase Trm11